MEACKVFQTTINRGLIGYLLFTSWTPMALAQYADDFLYTYSTDNVLYLEDYADGEWYPENEIELSAPDTLLGTIISAKTSMAVIRFKNKVHHVRVGSWFQGNKVVKILKGVVWYKTGTTSNTLNNTGFNEESIRRYEINGGVERDGNEVRVTRQLAEYISKENLATVMMQAASEPIYSSDGLYGFQISLIDPDSIYDLVGIEDGDIITHIDGVPLDTVASVIASLRYIRSQSEFTFTYDRGGIPETVSVLVR